MMMASHTIDRPPATSTQSNWTRTFIIRKFLVLLNGIVVIHSDTWLQSLFKDVLLKCKTVKHMQANAYCRYIAYTFGRELSNIGILVLKNEYQKENKWKSHTRLLFDMWHKDWNNVLTAVSVQCSYLCIFGMNLSATHKLTCIHLLPLIDACFCGFFLLFLCFSFVNNFWIGFNGN